MKGSFLKWFGDTHIPRLRKPLHSQSSDNTDLTYIKVLKNNIYTLGVSVLNQYS